MKPTTFKELSDIYLSSPSVTTLAKSSIKRYTNLSNSLLTIMNPEIQYNSDVSQASALSREWYTKIREACESNAMVNDRKGHVYRIYNWGMKNFGVPYDSNPAIYMENLKHEKKETNPFTPDDVRTIKNYPLKGKNHTFSTNEELTVNIIEFLFETGMRPEEMINLKLSDIVIDGKDKLIAIRGAKAREANKVSRYLFVTPRVQACIDYAIAHRASLAPVAIDNLWLSVKGSTITQPHFNTIFHKVLVKVNMPNRQVYDLRRGCATTMIHSPSYGATVAQKQLGHKHLSTTMLYENLDKRSAARLFKGFDNTNQGVTE